MRYALRALLRTPGFTAIAVLTLAIGIGTTTTIFAVVDELMLQPARATDPPDVYFATPMQIPDYETLAATPPPGVVAIAAYESGQGLLQIPGRAERLRAQYVGGRFADVQGVRPQAGRWITDEDNLAGEPDPKRIVNGVSYPLVAGTLGADVIVISDRIWREWFGASPRIVNQLVTFNTRQVRVIGVAPEGFRPSIDAWVPFGRRRLLTREELDRQRPTRRNPGWVGPLSEPQQPKISSIVRIAPDQSVTQVAGRMTAAVAGRPPSLDMPASVIKLKHSEDDVRRLHGGYVILGFAALIFVAACANLGNMLFARATEREGELAVRVSLGASRGNVFALLFSEIVLICLAAAGSGLAFAAGALRLLARTVPAFPIDYWKRVTLDLSVDWRVFGFAAAAGAIAAVVVGAASLWRSSRVSLLTRLAAAGQAVVAKTEGRTLRTMLVAVQVTAAVLLLIATGMLLENSSNRLNRRVWFDMEPLLTATLELPRDYDQSRGSHFFQRVLADIRAMPGVSAAALADALPAGENPAPRGAPAAIQAEPPERGLSGVQRRIDGHWIFASPGFIDTLGLTVTRGRDFGEGDDEGTEPVVLVTESTARRLWPGADPIGKRLTCCGATYWRRVVGLVPDPTGTVAREASHDIGEAMQELSGENGAGTFVFVPAGQGYKPSMLIVVRSDSPRGMVQPLRDRIGALDPAVPVFDAGPVGATQFTRLYAEKGVRLLAGALGLIALAIAIFGVYAVVSYFVSRRTREFGLRLALGSTRAQVGKLVIDYAIHIVLIGLLPGVLFASWGTRFFQAELRDLHPNGLTVWIAVPILMLVAGIVAAYVPARRAAKTNPYTTLKEL